jgi:hypothetical protein
MLPLDRFDDAVVLEDDRGVALRWPERLLVGLAALDCEAVVALELRAARVVAPPEPLLRVPAEPLPWVPRRPVLRDPLGLAPLRRDRLDVDRRLLELLDVVERSAMTLLGMIDLVRAGVRSLIAAHRVGA